MVLSAVAILFGVYPKATATQFISSRAQFRDNSYHLNEIDMDWLKAETQTLFAKNKVTQIRGCNGSNQEVIYRAPSLNPAEAPPSGLPKWLHWAWKSWEYLKAPWEVRYPHQWFWDSGAHAIVLSHFDSPLAKK